MQAVSRRFRWIERLNGEAHGYAVEYMAWWCEGGREPKVDGYVERAEDAGERFSHGRAREIAARIRLEVRS